MGAAAVIYVTDLTRMRVFYERCFGMSTAQSTAGEFSTLVSDGWELSLVVAPEATRTSRVIAQPPRRRAESPVKLAFDVASVDGLRTTIADAGGVLEPAESAWTFSGRRLLDCLDPEGNVVQLREPLVT